MTTSKKIPHFDSVKEAEESYAYTLLRLQKVLRSRKVDAMTANLIAELVKIVAGMREVQNLRYNYADKMARDMVAHCHAFDFEEIEMAPKEEEWVDWWHQTMMRKLFVYEQVSDELNGTNNREHA